MTNRYVVIGNPIAHSQSPFIHNEFARQTLQSIQYKTLLSPLNSFQETVEQFVAVGGLGANVTVPFKEQAFNICGVLSDSAKNARAVNTLSLTIDGKLRGDNTDGYGLVTDLQKQFGTLEDKRILIVGAGGASRGCIFPLLTAKVRHIVITNRTESKANKLIKEFNNDRISQSSFANLIKQPEFDVIINATAASLSGTVPALPKGIVNSRVNCYDMVYAGKPTAFMTWAASQNVKKMSDGLGMLVYQAAKSFEIWTGVEPNTEHVLKKLREKLRETE